MTNQNSVSYGCATKISLLLGIALCGLQGPVGVSSFATDGLSRGSLGEPMTSLQMGRSIMDEAPPGVSASTLSKPKNLIIDAAPGVGVRSQQKPRSLIIEAPQVVMGSNNPSSLVNQATPSVRTESKKASTPKPRPLITTNESSEVRNYEAEIAALKEELAAKTSEFGSEQRAWQTERVRFIELITHVGSSLALRYEEIAALSKVVTEYAGREEELEERIRSLNNEFVTDISDLERRRGEYEKLAADNHFEYGVDMNSAAGQENQQNVFMWVQPNEQD